MQVTGTRSCGRLGPLTLGMMELRFISMTCTGECVHYEIISKKKIKSRYPVRVSLSASGLYTNLNTK